MATWKPRTVKDVVQDIDESVYVLPVIQRWLVWNEAKMELLFDSLLKGNSFGGIMVLKEEKDDRPLFASRRFSRFGEEHQSSVLDKNERTTFLVIDGQQRLQTFYMGLKGGINNGKRLYFNLLSSPLDYEFRFIIEQSELPKSETGDSEEPVKKLWYRVEALFERLRAAADPYIVAGEIVRREMIEDQNLVGNVQQNVLVHWEPRGCTYMWG